MIELVLPVIGGVGIAGAATGAAVYVNRGPAWLPNARRWEKDFHFHREALVRMVNDTYEGTAGEILQHQIDILLYAGRPVRGYENTDANQTPVALTSVMEVDTYDETVEWIVPFYERGSHFSVMTKYPLDRYIKPLNDLCDLIGTALMGLAEDHPAVKSVDLFLREHAAHLLLNYRPSAREKKRFSKEETVKSMVRQRRLHTLLTEATRRAQKANRSTSYISGYDAVEEAKALAANIASSNQGKKVTKEIEPVESAPELQKADPVLPGDYREALAEEEVNVISLYNARKGRLIEEDRRLAQGLLQKMYSAVELAVKAESFSDAARTRAVTLANQNRIYASTELEGILRAHDGLTAEEAEAIHSLRLDNKYLAARKSENQTQKEIANV